MDKDNFLRLMFACTTNDVYLTLIFKFEIYSTNFCEITYPWPYINSVIMLSIFCEITRWLSMAFNKQVCCCDDQY